MATRLSLTTSLNKPYINSSQFEDESHYALLEIEPVVDVTSSQRSPLNIVIVIDSSGTMYNFQLDETERDYWMGLALSRDEMERGEADSRDAVFWSGQTLQDMSSIVRKPITLAVDAIKELLHGLQFGDQAAVIAFADSPLTIFGAADWKRSAEECFGRLDALVSQQLSVDIGSGTKMAQPLNNAFDLIRQTTVPGSVNRIIVISDGIVQDEDKTNAVVETIKDGGLAISTIGVGDDFDEEFLMNVADVTRGGYHYAADIHTITSELLSELVVIKSTAIRQLHVAAQGIDGTVVQDIYMAKPNMTIFDEIEATNGWINARIGDLPGDLTTGVLIQFAPAKLSNGMHDLITVELSWQSSDSSSPAPVTNQQQETIRSTYTADPTELQMTNADVQQLVDRFKVYKYEREAQSAHEQGDTEKAKEKLGAATRQLRALGENSLADDVDAQINALGTGVVDSTLGKRIKATTRKLGAGKGTAPIEQGPL